MKIQVTQEDIEKGVRNVCAWCPVARAATRAFGKPMKAMRWRLEDVATGECIETPKEVSRWMFKFDDHQPVEPFEFEVSDGLV